MIIFTCILSVISNYYFNKKFFFKYPILLPYLLVEVLLFCADSLINLLNNIENVLQGSMLLALVMIYVEIHCVLHVHCLEDFIFKDMGIFGGIRHNIGFYIGYICCIPLLYLFQYYESYIH
jgi:hypothetical protein